MKKTTSWSLVVAIFAAGAAAYFGIDQYMANLRATEVKLVFVADTDGNFVVRTVGPGTATIKKVRVWLGKEEQNPDYWFYRTLHAQVGIPECVEPKYTIIGGELPLGPRGQVTLYGFTGKGCKPEEAKIHELNGLVTFRLCYCSSRDECKWLQYPKQSQAPPISDPCK